MGGGSWRIFLLRQALLVALAKVVAVGAALRHAADALALAILVAAEALRAFALHDLLATSGRAAKLRAAWADALAVPAPHEA